MSVISTYHYFGKHNYEQNCTFNIQIIAKDGKFKYTFSNIVETSGFGLLTSAKDCPNPPTLRKIANEVWTTTKDEVDIKMRNLAISLKEAMVKKSTLDF